MTVVVLPLEASGPGLDPNDVVIEMSRGSGPGGQHRNKTETLVKALHRPTGISARVDGRSQYQNKEQALRLLAARVGEFQSRVADARLNQDRRSQMQGERAFTWTQWRDEVANHRTGRKIQMSRALKGDLEGLL